MNLPPQLLSAVTAIGGGKITLVVGAGCSFEPPTSIPLSKTCSAESHARLIADGDLMPGECAEPDNLSALADTVYGKTGQQQLVVKQLADHYPLKAPTPNNGHYIAAALLGERVINSIVTLNFDLALTAAISGVGVGHLVGIVDGPDELPNQKVVNLYYLHRNVNSADSEAWVLRTPVLHLEWADKWESVVAAKVLMAPVIVFVGLGTPASVLIESAKLIRAKAPNANSVYQVDPGTPATSAFFTALGIPQSAFIEGAWSEFMEALSNRLVTEHVALLVAAANAMAAREGIHLEDLTPLAERLLDLGLVNLGSLRAHWLLDDSPYRPELAPDRERLADLLLAVGLIARFTGSTGILFDDGVVEFRRGTRTAASYLLFSGGGTYSGLAIEGLLPARMRSLRRRSVKPAGAIVSANRPMIAAVSVPNDVVMGMADDNIISGAASPLTFYIDVLRADPATCTKVVP